MSIYSDMLDALVVSAANATGVAATRDPSEVAGMVNGDDGGCVFVGFPVHVGRLMEGPNLEVPVSLVGPAPSDLRSVDWLLDNMDALVDALGARSVINGPIDIGGTVFPAVTVTAQIALNTNGA